jgi:hypothetical protein
MFSCWCLTALLDVGLQLEDLRKSASEKKSIRRERAYGHLLLLALCLDVRNLLFDTVAVTG